MGRTGACLSPLVPARRATWPNGEWGYSARRHTLEPVRPEAVLPDRALYLPTFTHLLIVNKLLSLSLQTSVCPSKSPSRSLETARPVGRASAVGEGFGIPNRSPDPLVRRAGRDHPLPKSAGSPWRGRDVARRVGHGRRVCVCERESESEREFIWSDT